MRVLIMSDMEGVSGIVVWDQVNGGAPMYEEGRQLYTEEINAAVRGAKAAGATFVARSTTYHVQQTTKIIRKAILHEGFAVVEVMSQCPTYFGRKNRAGSAVDMMEAYKENTTPVGSKAKKENPDLIERGIFIQEDRPEYCSEYDQVIERAMKGN